MNCPHCGEQMQPGGVALACGPDLTSARIQLPPRCVSRTCQAERDKRALERAIQKGIIDP